MRKNNKLIIIISIILVLLLAGALFAYLFLATDVFKSNKEMFGKYLTQELEKIEKFTELDTVRAYQNLVKEDKYESNTNAKLVHSEGGEVSNPLNNLSMKTDFQKDAAQQYFYGNGQIIYGNETYFSTELIKDKEQYGIRFPQTFKQFVTINQDEDVQFIADNLDIDMRILETLILIMNGTEEIVSEDQINEAKDKYLNTITSEISKGIFEKQKDAMITYNGVTTKTNAYSVSLESRATKITIYVANEQAIRTVIETDENEIIIENSLQEGENQTKIRYSNLSGEKVIESEFKITKINVDNQENIEIQGNVLAGEESYEIIFVAKMKPTSDEIKFDVEMSVKQDITTKSLILENTVKIGNEFEKKQTLTENNFKSLSSIQDENKRKQIIDSVKQLVIQQVTGKKELLIQKLMIEDETTGEENKNEETVPEISQGQINNFNAKFEFYTGEEVSAENVKVLLDIVKGNCSGHTIMTTEATVENENTEAPATEEKDIVTLYIEEGATNDESITKVLEKIDDNQKYKVLISYKETNGLIDFITITEI